MKRETLLLINDIERMSDSLLKLLHVADTNEDLPHDHRLMLKGIEEIQRGTSKVINSIVKG